MADGGAARCLSDLSDDLLRHILFLAPDKEDASTAVLSRRWRWLWRTSGAVFLDSRSFIGECSSPDQDSVAVLRGAEKAIAAAAAHGPIPRLTFIVEGSKANLVEALVSNTAAQRVEKLKIIVRRRTISLACPTRTAPLHGAAAFPMLVELHLQNCVVFLVDLHKIINSAPRLSTLHLKTSSLLVEKDDDDEYDYDFDEDDDHNHDDEQPYTIDDDGNLFGRLLIPAVTALVVSDCTYGYKASLEFDVPRLQYFTYRGRVRTTNLLSLKLQASSNMIQVDLDLTPDKYGYIRKTTSARESFQQFIQNFRTTKLLKLKLDFTTDHLAPKDNAGQDAFLGGLSFNHLHQLEIEAEYKPEFERPLMVMLANLLHSCPMVHDLRLKLRKRHGRYRPGSFIEKEAGVHFDRSVTGFRNRRKPLVSLGAEDDDNYYQESIVPGLTGEHLFSCLQYHLKRVSLKFFMDEPNSLGVQLAKFFAECAMVLQEIHIDDGCHEMLEHVNPTIRTWIAKIDNGSKQLNVKD